MKVLWKLLLVLAVIPVMAMAPAQAASFQEGTQYKVIVPAQPTVTETGKIEVVEIFSYGCSHCHRFEPYIERWLKTLPKNVTFTRMPAIFSPALALYARAYYTAETLGVLNKVHQPIFDAIHVEKRNLTSEEAFAELFAQNGVSKADFQKAFRSFSVEAKVRRAAELGKRYGIEATPSMVVNGKYRTDTGMGNGPGGTLAIVDFLIQKEQNSGK